MIKTRAENAVAETKRLRAEAKVLRKTLHALTESVRGYLKRLDALMHTASTHERGKAQAQLANDLQIQNDCARRFGLGIDLSTRKKSRARKQKSSDANIRTTSEE